MTGRMQHTINGCWVSPLGTGFHPFGTPTGRELVKLAGFEECISRCFLTTGRYSLVT
jgi:hypothetical protein